MRLIYIFTFVFFVIGLMVTANEKPNVIIIYADDLGNADVGYHKQRNEIPTPNIDALAKSGVHFTCGYVTAPVCGPSRAGMLTGNYQQSFGFDDNPGPYRTSADVQPGIPVNIPIIPNYLKPEGYNTACIGKWHVGHESDEFFPTNRGFDYFFGFLGGAADYYPKDNRSRTLFKNNTPVESEKEYLTDAFGREAVNYIKQNKDKPFFMYLAFNAVHGPLQTPPEKYIRVFNNMADSKRKILCGMQYAMDVNIGKITKVLEETGLRDNTLVFFVSDNGGKLKGNYSYNDPYKGEKGTLYEGGIRLPFCMSWPAQIKKASVYNNPVSTLDILPTILKATKVKTKNHLNGENLLPYIKNEINEKPHEYLFWRINHKWAVRNHEWKLVSNVKEQKPELYHIAEDKSETTNLYDQEPEIVKELLNRYELWSDKVGKPQWGWNPKVGNYIHHPGENFEGINTEQCTPLNNNSKLSFIENPFKTKGNLSGKVLKIASGGLGDQYGTNIKVSQFQIKNKLLSVNVFKEDACEVFAVIKGKKELRVKAKKQSGDKSKWQNMQFDFSNYKGPVNTMKLIFISPQKTDKSVVYIDDMHFMKHTK